MTKYVVVWDFNEEHLATVVESDTADLSEAGWAELAHAARMAADGHDADEIAYDWADINCMPDSYYILAVVRGDRVMYSAEHGVHA